MIFEWVTFVDRWHCHI